MAGARNRGLQERRGHLVGLLDVDDTWMPGKLRKQIDGDLDLRLAVLVKQMTGNASEIVLVPYERAYEAGVEDLPCRAPDIAKIQGLIAYRPGLPLPEMLERVIAYEGDRV